MVIVSFCERWFRYGMVPDVFVWLFVTVSSLFIVRLDSITWVLLLLSKIW